MISAPCAGQLRRLPDDHAVARSAQAIGQRHQVVRRGYSALRDQGREQRDGVEQVALQADGGGLRALHRGQGRVDRRADRHAHKDHLALRDQVFAQAQAAPDLGVVAARVAADADDELGAVAHFSEGRCEGAAVLQRAQAVHLIGAAGRVVDGAGGASQRVERARAVHVGGQSAEQRLMARSQLLCRGFDGLRERGRLAGDAR